MPCKVSFDQNGSISVEILDDGTKFTWRFSDLLCYNVMQWTDLLAMMKGEIDDTSKHASVGGGGNSYWQAKVVDSKFRLYYSISGSGGDSTFVIDLSLEVMIPAIEEIILIYRSDLIRDM
jgi:hypothetical protein